MTGAIVVVGLGAIAVIANPQEAHYQDYAGRQISFYLKENVCQNSNDNLPIDLGNFSSSALESYCKTLVDASEYQLGELIGQKTSHENYVFFSVYQTDIELPEPFPHYSFETLGILNNFYTFRAEKN
ncbi:MAG: DUF4359 domain-containing protein [Limnothrix sp.]